MSFTLLAIDPGSDLMGWAVSGHDGRSLCRSGLRKASAPPGAISEAARHHYLCGTAAEWLADLFTEFGVAVLVLEHTGTPRTHRSTERLRGALLATAWVREVAVVLVTPNAWQAWAGKHNGWTKADKSDEGDARQILAWAIATLDI